MRSIRLYRASVDTPPPVLPPIALAEQAPGGLLKRDVTPPTAYVSGGEVQIEPNRRLSQSAWFGTGGELGQIDQMVREWSVLQAGVLAWTLTTLSREWRIDPADGGDKTDLLVAEFLRTVIESHYRGNGGGMLGLLTPFAQLPVRGFVLGQPYYPVDKSLTVRDDAGKVAMQGAHVLQIAPIPSQNVDRWIAETGTDGSQRWGVEVFNVGSDERGASRSNITLKADQLVHARFLPVGDDPAPYGLMRPAWILWQQWRTLSKLQVNGWQKAAFGVPEIVIGPDANPGELAAVNSIVSNLRAGSAVRFSLPPGYSIRWHEVPFRAGEIDDTKAQLKLDALAGMFAQHVATGSANGTQALHGSQKAEFHQLAEVVARQIVQTLMCGPVDTAPLKRLCSLNFADIQQYPTLSFGPTPVADPASWADAIGKAATAGALTLDGGIEDQIRDAMDLPEMQMETREQWRARLENAKPPEVNTTPDAPTPPAPKGKPSEVEGDEGGEEADVAENESEVAPVAARERVLVTQGLRTIAAVKASQALANGLVNTALGIVKHLGELPHERMMYDRMTTGPRGRAVRALEEVVRVSETHGATNAGKDEVGRIITQWREATASTYAGLLASDAKDLGDVASIPVPGERELVAMLKPALRQAYRAGGVSVINELDRLEADPALARRVADGTSTMPAPERTLHEHHRHGWRSLMESAPGAFVDGPGRKVKAPKGKPSAQLSLFADIDPEEAIDAVARTTAAAMSGRLKASAAASLQAQGIGGTLPTAIRSIVTQAILDLSPGVERNQAQGDVNTVFGLGRAQQQVAEGVESFVYSNLLESETCPSCEQYDGTTFGAGELQFFATPFSECDGGDRCNCLILSMPPGV